MVHLFDRPVQLATRYSFLQSCSLSNLLKFGEVKLKVARAPS